MSQGTSRNVLVWTIGIGISQVSYGNESLSLQETPTDLAGMNKHCYCHFGPNQLYIYLRKAQTPQLCDPVICTTKQISRCLERLCWVLSIYLGVRQSFWVIFHNLFGSICSGKNMLSGGWWQHLSHILSTHHVCLYPQLLLLGSMMKWLIWAVLTCHDGFLWLSLSPQCCVQGGAAVSKPSSRQVSKNNSKGFCGFEKEEYSDGYDSDLMGDDNDRTALEGLTQLDREMVLFKRSEVRGSKRRIKEAQRATLLQVNQVKESFTWGSCHQHLISSNQWLCMCRDFFRCIAFREQYSRLACRSGMKHKSSFW